MSRKPTLIAYAVRDRGEGQKAIWTRIGAAWPHGTGPGLSIQLDALPIDGRIVLTGGNATGVNFFVQEVLGKRLLLLHDLVPKAVRVAVLVNPANATIAARDRSEPPALAAIAAAARDRGHDNPRSRADIRSFSGFA